MRKDLLSDLNPQQQKAIKHTDGPLLVLAGAGSGKTKVITHRFAFLATAQNVPPSSILAMTFTNKAAEEMKARIQKLLGKDTNGLWVSTFHSFCCRILRREIANLGFQNNFCIYDKDDSSKLIRSILKEFKIHEALYKGISSKLSSLKASLITPEHLIAREDSYGFDEKFARVYVKYQDDLRRNNALDFDDLIMFTVKLFDEHPGVLKKYQTALPHIMIDEFQDTNSAQYRLVKLMVSGRKNICVVGDDDQSIYKFRGADVRNILAFEKDFPKTKVVRLEQNYRSTQNILDAAGGVIGQNSSRMPKKLWTDKGNGEKVFYCTTNNEREEAAYIARTINELYLKGRHSYGDFAILYRLNQQSMVLEEALKGNGLPYHIVGGISFYQRKEIKDIISYLKLITNPDDSVSLRRIINSPPRGIGSTTIAKIENEAVKRDVSLFKAMQHIVISSGYPPAFKEKIKGFVNTIEELSSSKDMDLSEFLWLILESTGYMKWIGEERAENLTELVNSSDYMDINSLIDTASLFSPMDESDKTSSISLMTLHCAKGLEFPVVFIAGLEEGLMPHFHAVKSSEDLQEERRLFYVGITRAKEMLFLTGAQKRRFYASVQEQQPSRFLKEMPLGCYHCIEKRPRTSMITSEVKLPAGFLNTTPFVTGVRVRHPKWGVGVVRDSYGETDDVKVMVNFPSVGVKRLSLKFAQLQKI
jgi:DNA helicase II / ATP-dependent DNA helicase PcrA